MLPLRLVLCGALALVLLSGCSTAVPPAPAAGDPPRLVLISWDGAADWVVDRLLAEGRLPHLAALAARGARAEHSLTGFPSKTAVGHATAFTGCWSDRHGILSNDPPYLEPGRTLLETRSGFDARGLLAEPIFVTAAKAGRRVVVLSATQSYPPAPHLAALGLGRREKDAGALPSYLSISGFEHWIADGELLGPGSLAPASREWGLDEKAMRGARELTTRVADSELFVLLYDDPGDPAAGLDTALVRAGSRRPGEAIAEAYLRPYAAAAEAPLDPRAWWSEPLPVRRGEQRANVFFRLFALSPDGGELALYRRRVHALDGAWPEPLLAEYLEAYPGFHDDPFWLYRDGGFGPPLMAGGDGEAERRVLDVVAHDLALTTAGTRWALERLDPDVLLHYTPMSDSAGHLWMGVLDPDSPAYDAKLAAELWPFYRRVFELQDAWLGSVLEAGGEAVVALISDHGMQGIDRYFQVNRVLERAGLVVRDAAGEIDLARSRALAPPISSPFSVWINGRHRGGIVAAADRDAVLAEAERALLAAVDPDTGEAPVLRVLRPGDEAIGFGPGAHGANDAVLYFDLAPRYYPRSTLGTAPEAPIVTASELPWGEGAHGYWPERRPMHAIFYLAGPGVAAGVELPPVRHVDIAPTLASLIGIPVPPCATGGAIDAAFAAR